MHEQDQTNNHNPAKGLKVHQVVGHQVKNDRDEQDGVSQLVDPDQGRERKIDCHRSPRRHATPPSNDCEGPWSSKTSEFNLLCRIICCGPIPPDSPTQLRSKGSEVQKGQLRLHYFRTPWRNAYSYVAERPGSSCNTRTGNLARAESPPEMSTMAHQLVARRPRLHSSAITQLILPIPPGWRRGDRRDAWWTPQPSAAVEPRLLAVVFLMR